MEDIFEDLEDVFEKGFYQLLIYGEERYKIKNNKIELENLYYD